ncbi:MAG: hypothetical protein K8R37_05120 [Bacteroidales bacterium]|nr:hypothetical protein [Bacteroidales bacterium]
MCTTKDFKDRKEYYKNISNKIKRSRESQVSLTDPDSRAFPKKFKVGVGYNAQVAVDDKNHLIVEQDVTNAVTVFGTIKFWNEQDHFLMRGLEKVKAEFSLSALSYNITRTINVVGVNRLIEAL